MDVRGGVYIFRLQVLVPYLLSSGDGIRTTLGCPIRSISSLFPCGGLEPHFPGVRGVGWDFRFPLIDSTDINRWLKTLLDARLYDG